MLIGSKIRPINQDVFGAFGKLVYGEGINLRII
jgi:hypothetical protein